MRRYNANLTYRFIQQLLVVCQAIKGPSFVLEQWVPFFHFTFPFHGSVVVPQPTDKKTGNPEGRWMGSENLLDSDEGKL
jgi:hypothetical protein